MMRREGGDAKGQYSLSYRIMQIFLIFGIITICSFFTLLYLDEKRSIESEYLVSHKYAEESLIHAVHLADQSLSLYDNIFNSPLRLALLQFLDTYNQTGGDPGFMDLETLRDEIAVLFSEPVDLYVIDDTNTIRYSTFEPDIGLSFEKYPKFIARLEEIRAGDEVAYDAIVTGVEEGEIRKYAYIPTPDNRYVLEIGLNLDEIFRSEGISKYPNLASRYSASTPDAKSVWIFDRSIATARDIKTSIPGFDQYPYEFIDNPERREHIMETFLAKETIQVGDLSDPEIIRYVYIPEIKSKSVSSGLYDKVAEITYSTEGLRQKHEMVPVFFILSGLIVIALLAIGAVGISRYIAHPVYQIIEDIEKIADGDYTHQIRRTKGIEFKRLEASIQKMVTRLQDDIISIRQKSELLDEELRNRRTAEDSLRTANQKLSLLTSITRHDMLNQISVVASGLDILQDDIPQQNQDIRVLSMIKTAISNIQTQIEFTRIYEQMGVEAPVWHSLSDLIAKSRREIRPSFSVTDTTGTIEILADPLFNRVIFNLIENAMRHGDGISMVEFSFSVSDGEGVLLISDDGNGVAESEKERIFERGFGKNTGLGLFLTREILSLTGMEIHEIGEEGKGAVFEIRIPPGNWRKN